VSWLQAIEVEPVVRVVNPRRRKPLGYSLQGIHPGRGGRQVKWGRRTYETIRQCADDVGLSIWAVRRRLGLKKDERKRHDVR
jgi:hypothetical protein